MQVENSSRHSRFSLERRAYITIWHKIVTVTRTLWETGPVECKVSPASYTCFSKVGLFQSLPLSLVVQVPPERDHHRDVAHLNGRAKLFRLGQPSGELPS